MAKATKAKTPTENAPTPESETSPKKLFATVDELMTLHDYAKGLYTNANTKADEILDLMFGELKTKSLVADGPKTHRPSRPRSYVENVRRSITMGVGAEMTPKVLPLKDTDAEEAKCSKLEYWIRGVDRRLEWQTNRDYKRDAGFWYAALGRTYLEARFRREYQHTDKFGFQVYADDPRYTYPVRGRDGIMYYTKECDYYVRELRADLSTKKRRLHNKLAEMQDTEKVTVIEYMDANYYACACEGEFLLNHRHGWGFIPLAEAHCMDTPLPDAEYAFGSVIAPVIDELLMQAEMIEKMRLGMEFFFFPMMYYVSSNGDPVVFNPYQPVGTLPQMPTTADIKIVPVNVNHQIFNALMSVTQSNINVGVIPENTFGISPESEVSGFAIAQVLQQSGAAIRDKLPSFSRALARNYSSLLRLAEEWADLDGIDSAVPVDYDD